MYYINLPSENRRWKIPDDIMSDLTKKVSNKDIDIISYLSMNKIDGIELEDHNFDQYKVSL